MLVGHFGSVCLDGSLDCNAVDHLLLNTMIAFDFRLEVCYYSWGVVGLLLLCVACCIGREWLGVHALKAGLFYYLPTLLSEHIMLLRGEKVPLSYRSFGIFLDKEASCMMKYTIYGVPST